MYFKRILFVSDGFGEDEDALSSAITLAKDTDCVIDTIFLLPHLPANFDTYAEKFTESFTQSCQQMINSVCAKMSYKASINITHLQSKRAALAIIKKVLLHDYDLIVKQVESKNHDRGFKSLDMDLLRKCPCPVLLCRPQHQINNGKVAVAIDPIAEDEVGESLSKQLLSISATVTEASQHPIDVVSCWDFTLEYNLNNETWLSMSSSELTAEREVVKNRHLHALKKIIEEATDAPQLKINQLEGFAFVKVPEFVAENNIDLVIMGTVARTGIAGFIIGNTAENILQSITCSLFAVKPEGFVSPVTLD
jgi:nucleotide-binding universal stress UspA family protein